VQAALVHREDANLVGAPEPVLVRAHDAVRGAVLAFKIEHRVDEMFEQPRPGDRAVFRDMSDHEGRAAGAFGEFHQGARAIANLRDAAGDGLHLR